MSKNTPKLWSNFILLLQSNISIMSLVHLWNWFLHWKMILKSAINISIIFTLVQGLTRFLVQYNQLLSSMLFNSTKHWLEVQKTLFQFNYIVSYQKHLLLLRSTWNVFQKITFMNIYICVLFPTLHRENLKKVTKLLKLSSSFSISRFSIQM